MPGIEDFRPTDHQYIDLEDVIDGGTANEIADKLVGISANIREDHGVKGPIRFEMTPNSLCATWTPESAPVPEAPTETMQEKIERRRRAIYAKKLRKLREAQAAMDREPAPQT